MLKEIKEAREKYSENFKTTKIVLIIIFILFMVYVIFFTSSKNNNKDLKVEVNKDLIISLFDKINDNYTLTIEKNIDGESNKIIYYSSNNGVMYEVGDYLYFIYKNNIYKIGVEDRKMSKIKESLDFVDDRFSDFELIKSLIKYCDFEYVNRVKVTCKINYSDYLNEYNLKYKTDYSINYDNKMSMDIVYYEDGIGKVIIDYTNINKIINYSNSNIIYGIKITDVDSNDFSIILDNYKKELKK